MAGGMTSRGWDRPTLAERLARTRAADAAAERAARARTEQQTRTVGGAAGAGVPAVPELGTGAAPVGAEHRSSPGRHCWVVDVPGAPGRWPGLLAEWARRPPGTWHGRVVYAVKDEGRTILVETWVPAAHLEPT